ncbi:hypothetical protein NUW54_g10834 [Trametes sanguinea]|uniref:Uncharacterized protein n=1 Tax=Trametes sanguinea TaxID=158606 RepID=A0ACC1NS27_9APHY|nr:hypothetical protein NUW54_g10834 [Trametes sanguinea]
MHHGPFAAVRAAKRDHWQAWIDSVDGKTIWDANRFLRRGPTDGGSARIPPIRATDVGGRPCVLNSNADKGAEFHRTFFLPSPDVKTLDEHHQAARSLLCAHHPLNGRRETSTQSAERVLHHSTPTIFALPLKRRLADTGTVQSIISARASRILPPDACCGGGRAEEGRRRTSRLLAATQLQVQTH